MEACVCGGGSVGHTLAAVLGCAADTRVRVLTRRAHEWSKQIEATYGDDLCVVGNVSRVSSDAADVVPGANLVLMSVPAFARRAVLSALRPHLGAGVAVIALPGQGGFDWQAESLLDADTPIFGTHRTPYICRTRVYGRSVHVTGVAPELRLAGRPASQLPTIIDALQTRLGIPLTPVRHYLSVTLTPTNPICHPVRLYSLFGRNQRFVREPKFYGEWDDTASELLLRCDAELQSICAAIPLDLSGITTVSQHYGATDPASLTRRIRAIRALAHIAAPVTPEHGTYRPDWASRFFTEDIPYGLLVVRGIAALAGVPTPTMDMLLKWAEHALDTSLLRYTASVQLDREGPTTPQTFGIRTLEELVRWECSDVSGSTPPIR